ncbi:MAG: GUN4 domain-containing protein, partial [Cyanobacteria bacterium J06639_18]
LDSDFNDINSTEESNSTESRNIYTEGNYNESIGGDYIEIQGDYVINQDFSEVVDKGFSEFAAEIRELITQLKDEGCSEEDAQMQVANELGKQALQKPELKEKLLEWEESLSYSKANEETEVVREVVKTATNHRQNYSSHFTEITDENFQKLDELLRVKRWEEADFETAELIYNISQDEFSENYFYRQFPPQHVYSQHITVMPREDFNTINNLWLKYSNGRFGFSIQKDIWVELGGGSDSCYTPYEVEQKFGNKVGWRRKGEWLYYVDLYNSERIKPRGHFPLALMLSSGETSRCSIDFSIIKTIVGRMYKY